MEYLANVPTIGWVALILALVIVPAAIIIIVIIATKFLKGKNVDSNILKITEAHKLEADTIKQKFDQSVGKGVLSNQCQAAKNILQELRVRIYETAIKRFGITDKNQCIIMKYISKDITKTIIEAVSNDLEINHIAEKDNYQLEDYARGKARGYYSVITVKLYEKNEDLPMYNLPEIMEEITQLDVEKFFRDVYFSSRRIAGEYREKKTNV